MNNRVKELRKALGLSGEKFGERIGIKRAAVSQIETGKNGLSEPLLLSICREFNVNEDWLRTGKGEMFLPMDELSLDDVAESEGVDPLEKEIMVTYFSIDKDLRKKLIQHFKNHLLN